MFYLHLSNKTENLIRQLAEVLHLDTARDPFDPEFFIIQSQGMERMLSQRLSERFVSWCNYEYMLPTRFFALMADRLNVESGPEDYARDQLCWRLDHLLRTVSGKTFLVLNRYMADDDNGMKRYQLAQQLAYLFDQYQIMRLGMIDAWEQGRIYTKNPAELYQMELWKLLGEAIGHLRHRGAFLRDLIHLLNDKTDFSSLLPKRISVFGVHSLPPIFLNCLQSLSKHCDVHFYLLSPCESHWTEQMTRRMQVENNLTDIQAGFHPLLASLGQQGREFQQMLLQDITFADEFKSFEDPFVKSQNPGLLHHLQYDLLKGECSAPEQALSKDDSLIVCSAHSAHREMMILKDRILYWLDDDSQLMLKDIIVMAPDIQAYSALIPSIFHDIPHSIADRNPACSNGFIAVFLQFLNLGNSRFGWSEVLDLFEREEVYPHFEVQENELELIHHWVVSSGIRWGLSGGQKESNGLPGREECTWKSGLDRLMMGYAVGGTSMVDGILPYEDIEGNAAAPLGGLSLFCETLEQASIMFARTHSLAEWSEILADCVDRILVSDGSDALLALHKILAGLALEYGDIHADSVSFEVIRSWVEGAAEEKRSSSGFLRGQLTFCSMLPMRSIPFRKVCLLGLNDTVFPKNDHHPPFDLLGDKAVPGDRSRRSDDRYQFLEAIISARSSLYLSFVGQSIRSNDTFAPSVVVSELLEFVKLYGVNELMDIHPLHGFSRRYFSEKCELFSYDSKLLGVSMAIGVQPSRPEPWWQGQVITEKNKIIDIDQLFVFFQNPPKYFVNTVLGIFPERIASSLDEHEPFRLDSLQNYLVDQDLIEGTLNGFEQESLRKRIQAAGQWPLGTPGAVMFADKQKDQQMFLNRVQEQIGRGVRDSEYIDMPFDGVRIIGSIGSRYGDGSLLFRYASCKGKDLVRTWVHHCLCTVCLGQSYDTRLVMKDAEATFAADTATEDDLQELLSFFIKAQQLPLLFMPEPALSYAVQSEKMEKCGRGAPVAKAVRAALDSLNKGYEAEWELLFQGQSQDDYLGPEFLEMCEWFYQSIWKRAHVRYI